MRKPILLFSLVLVLLAGCSFDRWSTSADKPAPQTGRTDKNKLANQDVTDYSGTTSVSPLPDETITKVKDFAQRANLTPVKMVPTENPTVPVSNVPRTTPAPTPVAGSVAPQPAAPTPVAIAPQPAAPTPVAIAPKPATPTELPSPIKWLDTRPVDFSIGPKQDPTPPAPVVAEPTPAPAPAPASVAIVTPVVPAVVSLPADAIEARLAKASRDYPRDLLTQLDLQLLQMINGRQVPQLDGIAQLPKDDHEILSALMDSLSNLRSNLKTDATMGASQKARPLVDLGERLRAGADLHVGTLALCSRVDGFGVYQPMSVDRLPSGHETTAVLYCEVENFLSRQAEAGQWETNLSQEITLYNDRGQRVWTEKARPIKDLCRNRRHDFFVGQRVTLPSALMPGSYSLRVTIVDQNANRVAEATLGMKVISDR